MQKPWTIFQGVIFLSGDPRNPNHQTPKAPNLPLTENLNVQQKHQQPQNQSTKSTPWKINMEPTNHPFRKEHDLNHTSMIMFQPLIFRGVRSWFLPVLPFRETWLERETLRLSCAESPRCDSNRDVWFFVWAPELMGMKRLEFPREKVYYMYMIIWNRQNIQNESIIIDMNITHLILIWYSCGERVILILISATCKPKPSNNIKQCICMHFHVFPQIKSREIKLRNLRCTVF